MIEKGQAFKHQRNGYNREEVDNFLAALEAGKTPELPTFSTKFHGYKRDEVDAFLTELKKTRNKR
jgi:DivIVA domain-containing protein